MNTIGNSRVRITLIEKFSALFGVGTWNIRDPYAAPLPADPI